MWLGPGAPRPGVARRSRCWVRVVGKSLRILRRFLRRREGPQGLGLPHSYSRGARRTEPGSSSGRSRSPFHPGGAGLGSSLVGAREGACLWSGSARRWHKGTHGGPSSSLAPQPRFGCFLRRSRRPPRLCHRSPCAPIVAGQFAWGSEPTLSSTLAHTCVEQPLRKTRGDGVQGPGRAVGADC